MFPWSLVAAGKCKIGKFIVDKYQCCGEGQSCVNRDDNTYQICCDKGKMGAMAW